MRVCVVDAEGKAKYSPHALRHFFVSCAIDRGFPIKKVQALAGHATLAMTSDTYRHLFRDDEETDLARFVEGERDLRKLAAKSA